MVNVHHLELFYYVALYRGISQAARQMPYGIQPSAVSEQIRRLEQDVRALLFARRPFRLTRPGRALFDLLQPFFEDLERIAPTLGREVPQLRIAAPESVLEHELPPVLGCMTRLQPEIQFTVRAGSGRQMRQWLLDGEVDLVVTALDERPPPGISARALLSLPLVLLVHQSSPIRDAAHFWRQRERAERLVCPDPAEGVGLAFHRGLRRGGLSWPVAVQASSAASVSRLVAEGQGVGVSLAFPRLMRHPKVRALPLAGFEPVTISMLWRTTDAHRLRPFISPIEDQARLLTTTWKSGAARAAQTEAR